MSVPKELPPEQDPARVRIQSVAHRGRTVARQDGRVLFIPFGIPDETVEVEVYREHRRYAEAEIVRIIEPSPDRVRPACRYFGTCGGCQLQHMSYERQLESKRQVVADLIERIGGFRGVEVLPTIPSPRQYGYRNSARYLTNRRGELGFTDWRDNRFLRVDSCAIMAPEISRRLPDLQGHATPGEQVRVRHSGRPGEEPLVWPPLEAPVPTGQPELEIELLGRRFRVSATSFFQVNAEQAETLVRLAVERLRPLDGQTALDAYCGVGTFTRFIAEEARHTIGIELAGPAVEDARANLEGLGVKIIEGAAEQELPKLAGTDVSRVLLDPPRTGCERPALDAILALAPEKVVYVSCEPGTLARDLKYLCSAGSYVLVEVQPVDMFPQTYHVETVATLHAL